MNIKLTENQKWFIQVAINLKNAVIQFNGLDDEIFEEDYGISKEDLLKEIKDLEEKLNK